MKFFGTVTDGGVAVENEGPFGELKGYVRLTKTLCRAALIFSQRWLFESTFRLAKQ